MFHVSIPVAFLHRGLFQPFSLHIDVFLVPVSTYLGQLLLITSFICSNIQYPELFFPTYNSSVSQCLSTTILIFSGTQQPQFLITISNTINSWFLYHVLQIWVRIQSPNLYVPVSFISISLFLYPVAFPLSLRSYIQSSLGSVLGSLTLGSCTQNHNLILYIL